MPQVGLLIFLSSSIIVLLGATKNSPYPGTGLPIDVKRTVTIVPIIVHSNYPMYLWYCMQTYAPQHRKQVLLGVWYLGQLIPLGP
jgi:hypothetical protein